MIDELASIVVPCGIPEYGLQAGDLGTVVMVHQNRAGYTVEFMTLNGDTVAVVTLPADQVRPIRATEIARVRDRITG